MTTMMMINRVINLVRPHGETTPQRGQGLADLFSEEAHPTVSNPR